MPGKRFWLGLVRSVFAWLLTAVACGLSWWIGYCQGGQYAVAMERMEAVCAGAGLYLMDAQGDMHFIYNPFPKEVNP